MLNLLFVSYPRRVGPVACRDGTELSFCSSAFILHLFSPPACPVLFCSAPRSVSLSLISSLLPSPPLFAAALFWLVSLAGQGVTRAEEGGRGGCRNVKLCLLILSEYSITTLFWLLLHPWPRILWSFSRRWQSMVSDSEVGPLDKC